MVRQQRLAMLDPGAPNASVEAILHAIIPFRFVDHSHADAVLAITNAPDNEARVREVFGPRILTIPYVMPGFVLAKAVYERTRDVDWDQLDGIVLLNHGLFTFHDDARASYEQHIKLVTQAEEYLSSRASLAPRATAEPAIDLQALAKLRACVSRFRGIPVLAKLDDSPALRAYADRADIATIGARGPVTPDHSIRTKRTPVVLTGNAEQDISDYASAYRAYFDQHNQDGLTCLDPAPRWAIWPGAGLIALGADSREAAIIADIAAHTAKVVQLAESLGGWEALSPADIFDVEYWELEQAKLRKQASAPPLRGKIALVTGAASGIGRATCEQFLKSGAAVVALDVDPKITTLFNSPAALGLICDLRNPEAIRQAVNATVRHFGGLDIVVSNAGVFSPGEPIETLSDATWDQSLQLNLTQHKNLLQVSIPFLRAGIDPAIVVIGSKNVPAPGPGAVAYSAAKAGLTQLVRVAALELAADNIRVNILHPDAVYDTGIWSDGVLETRAANYGLTVSEYTTRNLLKTAVSSQEVAALVEALAGPLFARTTGAQIPIDGGNDRVV